jgi:ATP/maltotriose-dependent transcriptional regulator MalT
MCFIFAMGPPFERVSMHHQSSIVEIALPIQQSQLAKETGRKKRRTTSGVREQLQQSGRHSEQRKAFQGLQSDPFPL